MAQLPASFPKTMSREAYEYFTRFYIKPFTTTTSNNSTSAIIKRERKNSKRARWQRMLDSIPKHKRIPANHKNRLVRQRALPNYGFDYDPSMSKHLIDPSTKPPAWFGGHISAA